jgi:hypothetical protein
MVTNPSTECGRATTVISAGALPSGWALRTCAVINVALTPSSSCDPSSLVETSWVVARVSDRTEILGGVGTNATTTYCGPVNDVLEFNISDALGE